MAKVQKEVQIEAWVDYMLKEAKIQYLFSWYSQTSPLGAMTGLVPANGRSLSCEIPTIAFCHTTFSQTLLGEISAKHCKVKFKAKDWLKSTLSLTLTRSWTAFQ